MTTDFETPSNAALGDSVTSVIRHRIRPGRAADYEAWLKEIVPSAKSFAGHNGVNILRPHGGSDVYTVVLHFDALENLRAWLDSPVRAALIAKVHPLLVEGEHIEIQTGLEFWFTPSGGPRMAKPYKQFLLTLSAIFPLSLLVPLALHPLFVAVPMLDHLVVRGFIGATILVALMIYVVMPRYVRLVAKWLYT